jgi:predicted Zn-dependent protease
MMGGLPLLTLLSVIVLAGCSLGSGKRSGSTSFPGLEGRSASIGAHARILRSYGGAYEDPALSAYVEKIVETIALQVNSRKETYVLTILDSPLPNAMALSDGHIYITRGMLALINDEAQLAGVLAHEMGHVSARHIASRREVASNISLLDDVVAGVIGDFSDGASGLVSRSGLLAGYSRIQEDEADRLAVTYLDQAGYDPLAVSDVLQVMDAYSRHRSELARTEIHSDTGSWMANHPETRDRARRTAERAHSMRLSQQTKVRARARYLSAIDGLVYGTSPDQGYVRGQRFVHAIQGYQFEVPDDFRLVSADNVVWAIGPEKVIAKLDDVRVPIDFEPATYLTDEWAGSLALTDVRQFEVAGLASASAGMRFQGLNTLAVVIAARPGTAYRFLIGVPPQVGDRYRDAVWNIVTSFQLIDRNDAGAGLRRITTLEVPRQGRIAQIAADLDLSSIEDAELELLNGLATGDLVPARKVIKLIAEDLPL